MEEWKEYKLGDVCEYNTERISLNLLNEDNYISTENMLPNIGGITISSNLPTSGSAIHFCEGDTLISNIRPYFKKIWYADKEGGCSADVLCMKVNKGIDKQYLYYLLAQQDFFDYVMAGAKGCKMPRGDKQHIMNWEITLPSLPTQQKIANILSSLDDKIEVNRRINEQLEEMAQALFKSWFVDFEPFKEQPFVETELGMIPEGWKVGNLLDVAELFDNLRRPLSGRERDAMDKIYPYYGATSIMDYVDKYIFDGIYLLMGEDGSVVNDKGYPYLQYVWGKFWPNNHAHVMQGKNGYTTEMLHALLSITNVKAVVTGAVQAKISQAGMRNISITIAPKSILDLFSEKITPIYNKIRENSEEILHLTTLRDTLLPKLMSGEIDVNEVNI